jgi:hypothetical protein
MEFLKDLGIVGFWFFLIKGLLWLVLFALVYFGLLSKEKLARFKQRVYFWKSKKTQKDPVQD